MRKSYAWLAVIGVFVVVVMLAFTPRAEWFGAVLTVAAILVFTGVLMVRPVRQVAMNNRRATMIGGVCAIGVGTGILLAGIFASKFVSVGVIVGAFSILLLVGIMLIQVPRISGNMESAITAQKEVERALPSARSFGPVDEVKQSIVWIWTQKLELTKVSGPWTAIFLTSYMVVEWIAVKGTSISHRRDTAVTLLMLLFAVLLAGLCSLLVAMIQWTRFVATRESSCSKLSGRDLWGWLWRWVIFGSIFVRGINQVDVWLRSHVPHASPWELLALDKLTTLIILVLASPFALGLPAVALGEPSRATEARTKSFRLVGRKYYVGVALVLLPYYVVSWIIGLTSQSYSLPAVQFALYLAGMVMLFATAVVAMTYITRVYLKGAAISGGAAA